MVSPMDDNKESVVCDCSPPQTPTFKWKYMKKKKIKNMTLKNKEIVADDKDELVDIDMQEYCYTCLKQNEKILLFKWQKLLISRPGVMASMIN